MILFTSNEKDTLLRFHLTKNTNQYKYLSYRTCKYHQTMYGNRKCPNFLQLSPHCLPCHVKHSNKTSSSCLLLLLYKFIKARTSNISRDPQIWRCSDNPSKLTKSPRNYCHDASCGRRLLVCQTGK